jgi:hypothetical protein
MVKNKRRRKADAARPHRPVQLAKEGTQPPLLPEDADVTPIVEFLHMFQELTDPRAQHPSKLISVKVPEPLLAAFKFKARQKNVPYQTMIKRLMVEWLRTC